MAIFTGAGVAIATPFDENYKVDYDKFAELIDFQVENGTDAIIVCGTNTWSQDVDIASTNPVKRKKNVMYTVHFYAATHGQSYRNKVQTAINNGLPVFCTEFSACESTGDGNINKNEANSWLNFLDNNNISYVCWSLSNKNESASLLKSSCTKTKGFKKSDLSTMGKWLKSKYN